MKVCTCGSTIPEARVSLGYAQCVDCSTEAKWSAIQVVHHKTGNETQIVKDPEVAEEFYAKSQRTGFGTLRGMTGSFKRRAAAKPAQQKVELAPAAPQQFSQVISRRPMPLDFEGVGKVALQTLEEQSLTAALVVVQEAEAGYRLLPRQAAQLRQILELLESEKTVSNPDNL